MIKERIIKLMLILMVIAFTAIVTVQWFWVRYAMKERQQKFTTQVYEVLNRVVNRVEEVNYLRYLREMERHLGTIQTYNEMLNETAAQSTIGMDTDYLFDVLHNDLLRRSDSRTYLDPMANASHQRSTGKVVNQEFIIQTIKSLSLPANTTDEKFMTRFSEVLQEFMLRVVKEKDPQNVDVQERLKSVNLSSLLETYFSGYNVSLPYTYSILHKKDILNRVKTNNTSNLYYVDLFPYDLVKKDYFLAVQFESIQPIFYQHISWMLVASAFCIFGLLAIFIGSIMIIMRQQKLSVIKNDFINNMTHEFKTPLATISLATSAILNEKVVGNKEQVTKFTNMIKNENNRMNKYVERILQQAKLDKKEFHLNKKEGSLNEMVGEAINHFMLQVQSAGGNLQFDEGEDAFFMYDEVHLMNVVCNLIDNSIKYSPSVPEIKIKTVNLSQQFKIIVKDKGIGISRDDQKKVFKRFYRVSTGNVHNVKGFGLGLSYAKTIVEMHGGQIILSSRKDEGTKVEITLPLNNHKS